MLARPDGSRARVLWFLNGWTLRVEGGCQKVSTWVRTGSADLTQISLTYRRNEGKPWNDIASVW